MDLATGTIVGGDFKVVRPLSEGGMGAVFVVEQLSTGAQRALKTMHPQLIRDARMRERFTQEARVGASIASSHVVEVIAAGIDHEREMPWLAMELLDGEDLAAVLNRRGRLPLEEVHPLIGQLCHALGAAHAHGIVHRDLKPENLFLAGSRTMGVPFMLKVLDFGIAKVLAEAQRNAQTAAMGTPTWMAPEQTEASSRVSPATDVWALGLIVFRLLVGRSYWLSANDPRAPMTSIFREVVLGDLPVATARAQELGAQGTLPDGFDAWFARCVVRDPAARFPDANAAYAGWTELQDGSRARPPAIATAPMTTPVNLSGTMPMLPQPIEDTGPAPQEPPRPRPVEATVVIPKAPAREKTVLAAPESAGPSKPVMIGAVALALAALTFMVWDKRRPAKSPEPASSGSVSAPVAEAEPTPAVFALAPPANASGSQKGIRWVVEQEGSGEVPKGSESRVTYHYTLMRDDGTVFSDSRKAGEPISGSLNQFVRGVQIMLSGMKPGERRRAWIPDGMGFGKGAQIADLELVSIGPE